MAIKGKWLCRHGYRYDHPCDESGCWNDPKAQQNIKPKSKADLISQMDWSKAGPSLIAAMTSKMDSTKLFGPVNIAEEASTTNPCLEHSTRSPVCRRCNSHGITNSNGDFICMAPSPTSSYTCSRGAGHSTPQHRAYQSHNVHLRPLEKWGGEPSQSDGRLPVIYVDGSASTVTYRHYLDALAEVGQRNGYMVFEAGSDVWAFTRKYRGGGFYASHVADWHQTAYGSRAAVLLTDGVMAEVDRLLLQSRNIQVIVVNNETSYETAYEAIRKATLNTLTRTATVQEDKSMSNRPSVVTTVSLDRAENVTIADLKSLIAEVERVGGDDTAQVSFSNSHYRWDVTLSVKANEVEPEPAPLTPEEESALLTEYRATGTSKARKTEIKNLLGL